MQATVDPQGLSLARRPMDLEDYLNIVRRNAGWIVGPTIIGVTLAVVIAFLWPDVYISKAAIRVVPPAVPERYVPTNVNVQMAERVNAMQTTILSRNTLTNIIQTYDLYRKERSRAPMEDIIEQMRKDIIVGNLQRLGGGNHAAFVIGFNYENRYVAQKVTRDLMTRFIDENIRERFQQSQQTTQFLQDQFEQAKTDLDQIEQKLTKFQVENAGRLPDSMGSNLNTMSVLESRVSSLNTNISRAKQEQMMLESEMRASRDRLNTLLKLPAETAAAASYGASSAQATEGDADISRADRDVQGLERAIEKMLEQYTPTYPDVQRLQSRLKAARKEREELLARKSAAKETPQARPSSAANPAAPRQSAQRLREVSDAEAAITRLQGQIRAKELEVERYVREIAEVDNKSKVVQGRIELGPVGAAQLNQLVRDHEMSKRRYDDFKTKLAESRTASEVEERKQGETLEVLDLPSLPETPASPTRPVWIAAGGIIGLIFGAGMAAVRELKDTSLKTLKDIRAYTQFNVLGSIPLLENDLVVRRRRRIGLLAWSSGCVLSAMIIAGSIYYYYSTKI